MESAYEAAGKEPNFGHWGRGIMLTGSLLGAGTRRMLELPFDYYSPFVIEGKEFREGFPLASYVPHDKAISETYEWFKNRIAK